MVSLNTPGFQYVSSAGWSAVTAWAASTAITAGTVRRQLATPTVGNERVFVCVVAGTTGGTEPTWILTSGASTTDGSVTWRECTGDPAINGDATNTPAWTGNGSTSGAKNRAIAEGQIIKNDSGTHYFMCTTAGTAGNGAQPSFNTTAGATTADNTVTWTSLGAVGSFSAWGAPHARLETSFGATWTKAGDTVYVASTHTQTQATGLTLSIPSTVTAPARVLSVDASAAPPTSLLAGASLTTTTNGAITLNGRSSAAFGFYSGISFSATSGTSTGSLQIGDINCALAFDNCSFNIASTAIANRIIFTSSQSQSFMMRNCRFTFSATAQAIGGNGSADNVEFVNCSFAQTGSLPTNLVSPGTSGSVRTVLYRFRACNLSNITGNLVNVTSFFVGSVIFERCRLAAGVVVATGTFTNRNVLVKAHNCDDSANNYRFIEYEYRGTIQSETTVVNNAGATNGTTRLSWNLATTARPTFDLPFATNEIAFWNEQTGSSLTASIEIAGANTLTDADIWLEVEYLGDASRPLSSLVSNRMVDLFAAPANHTTSAASWGGSPAVKQRLDVSFTPQMKGIVKARIYVARPSITVYIDPMLKVGAGGSTRQYLIEGGQYSNESVGAPSGNGSIFNTPIIRAA